MLNKLDIYPLDDIEKQEFKYTTIIERIFFIDLKNRLKNRLTDHFKMYPYPNISTEQIIRRVDQIKYDQNHTRFGIPFKIY